MLQRNAYWHQSPDEDKTNAMIGEIRDNKTFSIVKLSSTKYQKLNMIEVVLEGLRTDTRQQRPIVDG